MNTKMIGLLMRKDVYLVRAPVMFYMLVGAIAIGLMGVPGSGWFYAGCVLLITALMALGFHPTMATTVGERKEQTLAFVMSMPISPADYIWSKLLVNIVLFFVPWTVLLGGIVVMIANDATMPDGLIPYATILFGSIAASAVMILCVAIAFESIQWTIVSQIVCNLLFQGVMYAASNNPGIASSMYGPVAVWNSSALTFIGLEIAIAVLLFAATLWRQSRKTDFL